jgi:hypothetical protein
MKRNKRPLIWADNDTSGMLIDPYVGNVNVDTTADKQIFSTQWNAGGQSSGHYFSELYGKCTKAIKLGTAKSEPSCLLFAIHFRACRACRALSLSAPPICLPRFP